MWVLCHRHNVVPPEQWTTTTDMHLRWMQEQHQKGDIVLSGPGPDRTGMYLIRAATLSSAQQIAAGDPFTLAGHCTFDLIEWEIHQIMGIGPFTEAGLAQTEKSITTGKGAAHAE